MTTGNQSDSGTPVDGTSTKPPAPAHGGLWKVGIAAAVVAGLVLAFVSGWWLGAKRDTRTSRSSDSGSSRESREKDRSSRSSDGGSSSARERREEGGSSGAHGRVQLWEDGPYWAETNIGAENPEDYGYYFWWGDTVGYKRQNDAWVASDGSSRNFSFDEENTPTWGKSIDELKRDGWLTKDGVLAPKHDAAHVHWGGDWRMPTRKELDDLSGKCDWTWTTKKGVEGYIVRGRDRYASASIFLPAAGYGLETSLYFAGSIGDYWSSVPGSDGDDAWGLDFNSGSHYTSISSRFGGHSVRPVQGFTK